MQNKQKCLCLNWDSENWKDFWEGSVSNFAERSQNQQLVIHTSCYCAWLVPPSPYINKHRTKREREGACVCMQCVCVCVLDGGRNRVFASKALVAVSIGGNVLIDWPVSVNHFRCLVDVTHVSEICSVIIGQNCKQTNTHFLCPWGLRKTDR